MEELINQVSQKAGITPDQAQQAVNAVLDFAKIKLPAPLGDELGNLLQGNTPGIQGMLGQVAGGQGGGNLVDEAKNVLGGLFGGNKSE
jgi:hypothetical protein